MTTPRDLLALTVLQPWAWALAKGLKPVENRTWAPPVALAGRYLAIHAGKRIDEEGTSSFRTIIREPAVRTRLEAVHGTGELTLAMMPTGAIVAVGRLVGMVTREEQLPPDAAPWFCGPVGWLFADVREIEPAVPCRGAQKLWTVPADVADVVRERWAAAKRERGAA